MTPTSGPVIPGEGLALLGSIDTNLDIFRRGSTEAAIKLAEKAGAASDFFLVSHRNGEPMTLSRRSTLRLLASLAALPTLAALNRARAQTSSPLRIGVIGAGSMGGAVGREWVRAGHEVMFSSRNPDQLQAMARQAGPRASVGLPIEAARFGTVLLFTVPYAALPQLASDLRSELQGKIVLDACNPPGDDSELSRRAYAEGVAVTTARLLTGARVARAFSSVDGTQVAVSARRSTDKLGVSVASDDADALAMAQRLVRDAGCEPVVTGGLASATSFQRGGPGFRNHLDAQALRVVLGLPK